VGISLTRVPQWTGFARKTLWDWLQLLIVPAILIGVTFVWSATQTRTDNKREDRRIAADRTAAQEARRDATLRAYLDQMSRLMLEKKLLTSKASDAVRPVARSVTLTTLRSLDGVRRAAVLHFLYEARLIDGQTAVVSLRKAYFRGAELTRAVLEGANLKGANLSDAALYGANLSGADLSGANLSLANLSAARLNGAKLRGARLVGATLSFAKLSRAKLTDAELAGANLRDANLTQADLNDAGFDLANLKDANLKDANLEDAILGCCERPTRGLDLDRFITHLPLERQKRFLASQKSFLDLLPKDDLARFNLSAEKLARIRRVASGG
jgi:uncharacterized protein YjbI with pentapeptide repeats